MAPVMTIGRALMKDAISQHRATIRNPSLALTRILAGGKSFMMASPISRHRAISTTKLMAAATSL